MLSQYQSMQNTNVDPELWMKAKSILDLFDLDLDKLLKLKQSVESTNRKPTHLVLPQPEILGLKIEFCPRAIAPGIKWRKNGD